MENPFDQNTEKRLWERWKELQNYIKLSRGFSSTELNEWDKGVL